MAIRSNSRDQEHQRAEARLREQTRLADLHMRVSTALTSVGTLHESLRQCASALVDFLDAAFARIWLLNEAEQILELQASAGMYTHINGGHARIPVGALKIGLIAKERTPHLTNDVPGDPRISDHEWAMREGMLAFAGYPLLVGDRLVGVMAMFARHFLTEEALEAMASVANAIALGVERHRAEEALRQSEARLRFLTEAMPQKIFATDPSGRAIYVNSQWSDFTGLSLDEVKGWGWLRLLHPDEIEENLKEWFHSTDTGELFSFEHRLRGADGTYRWHLSRAIPIRDSQGNIVEWIGSSTDISEQKELERQKEILTSMATHELKTPLTSLRGYIQLAERRLRRLRNDPTDQQAEQKLLDDVLSLLNRSQQQIIVQNRLITDLLDIARLQERSLELHLDTCNLVSLVEEAVQGYQAAHPQRKISLTLPEEEALPIQADCDRITQVLNNYLSNALKYSAVDKEVKISIRCSSSLVRIWVADQGPGLSLEAQQHIWEKFYRTPGIKEQDNSEISLGLGLPICRGIIESHHGQVGVDSVVGQGSCFWFTLPLAPQQAE